MKKRVLGSFLMIVLMITMVFGFVPTKANAAVKYYNLNNEIKLIMDTSLNKVLKEGDQYKVEISVSDYGISNPTSAAVYEYNTPYDLGYGADGHSFDATSFRHDEVNHCYIVTLDRTVSDEATGYWYTMGVEFKNDSGISYTTKFSRQVWNNYIHYVWKPLNQELLVINRVSYDFVIGEKLQLKAMLLPSLQEVPVEWSSSDESIATVDSNGLVTSKKVGKVTIKAKYNSSGVDAVTYESSGSALESYHSLIKALTNMINHYHLLLNMDISTLEKCGKSVEELDKQLSIR